MSQFLSSQLTLHQRFQSIHLKHNCSKIISSDCPIPLLGKSVILWFFRETFIKQMKIQGFLLNLLCYEFSKQTYIMKIQSYYPVYSTNRVECRAIHKKHLELPFLPLPNNVTLCKELKFSRTGFFIFKMKELSPCDSATALLDISPTDLKSNAH